MVDEVFVGRWKGCESGLEVVLKGLQKKTLKKKLLKNLDITKILLTFAPAIWTKPLDKSDSQARVAAKKWQFFIRIYRTRFFEIIEQLNSFITLLLKSFQSNTFENKPRFNKTIFFYNGEFDPGSGWTLAAGLTHASRGGLKMKLALFLWDRRTGA